MNPDTGHLVGEPLWEEMEKREKQETNGYEQLPDHLNHAAKKKLKGELEAMVSLTSGGKLSQWASKRRKEKRKAQKQARKKNR